jgi:hypothetical protein
MCAGSLPVVVRKDCTMVSADKLVSLIPWCNRAGNRSYDLIASVFLTSRLSEADSGNRAAFDKSGYVTACEALQLLDLRAALRSLR